MTAKRKKTEAPAAKAKAVDRAKAPAEKKPGVISTIIEVISGPKGATTDEILAILAKKFQRRDAAGMKNTIRIQANKNATRKDKDQDGAVRYFGKT